MQIVRHHTPHEHLPSSDEDEPNDRMPSFDDHNCLSDGRDLRDRRDPTNDKDPDTKPKKPKRRDTGKSTPKRPQKTS